MHPLTRVVIWWVDEYGRKQEYETDIKHFNNMAITLLEKFLDKNYNMYYTVNNETLELDYYNTEL